jgi:membrane dipeptidase
MTSNATHLEKLHTESPYPNISKAWQAGLQKLQPRRADLEHGLDLHSRLVAVDHFGFLPLIHSPELEKAWIALREAQIGGLDYNFELSLIRQRAGVGSPPALEEFCYALACSGLSGVVQTSAEGKSRRQDLKRIAGFRGIERAARETLTSAGDAEDFVAARKDGKVAMTLSVNGPPVAGHLMDPRDEFQWLQTWHDLGVRLMHLTYNRRNVVGDGCAESTNAGLSDLGRELVARLNALGIIVDVPHSSEQTCLDAAKLSSRPMMASHTGRKSFHDHIRTKSDSVLKAIAGTGGLVGVVSLPSLLGRNGDLPTLLDAVVDMTQLIGIDHVGIATDYAYRSVVPEDFKHGSILGAEFKPQWWGNWKPGQVTTKEGLTAGFCDSLQWTNWPLFTVGLVSRGFSDADIEKILGGNFLRVLRAQKTD